MLACMPEPRSGGCFFKLFEHTVDLLDKTCGVHVLCALAVTFSLLPITIIFATILESDHPLSVALVRHPATDVPSNVMTSSREPTSAESETRKLPHPRGH